MNKTQAEKLAVHLRQRWMSYMDMLQTGISVSPWKRLTETRRYLREGEELVRQPRAGRVMWRIRKVA